MGLKALDFLRLIGWGIINFIYSLIDSLFEIIREMNAFDIINSLAENKIFKNLHSSVLIISFTLFGLFVIWKYVQKVIDPEEGLSIGQITKEVFKCGIFIILSTFLFSQVSSFSIALSGFTGNIFESNNTELSDSILELYVDYSEGYQVSDNPQIDYDSLHQSIGDESFTNAKMYNDKFVTNDKWIVSDEKDYIYKIDWIMAIIIGGFFLYALFFSGMMLARRQIEFLFLFVISPVVFATAVGNKQRRIAVIEQLVSLTLQAAVVMLIINITALIMQAVNQTMFFENGFQNILIKSIMFIGCGSFLLTGSQVVNRFIGGNVSANSGREQLMSLMGYGQAMSNIGTPALLGAGGATLAVSGGLAKGAGLAISNRNSNISSIGGKLQNFGNKVSSISNGRFYNVGTKLSNFGSSMQSYANSKIEKEKGKKMTLSNVGSTFSNIGSGVLNTGLNSMDTALNSIVPNRNLYRRRTRFRE